jgi:hypothetical protein
VRAKKKPATDRGGVGSVAGQLSGEDGALQGKKGTASGSGKQKD